MRHGHIVGVDVIGRTYACFSRSEMRNDLVAVEVEIDPVVRAAAFFAFENAAVKLAGRFEVIDRKSEVKQIFHIVVARVAAGAAVISDTVRRPDCNAPCIHEEVSERCSPAKWMRPSGSRAAC